jgi:hypothetical protein
MRALGYGRKLGLTAIGVGVVCTALALPYVLGDGLTFTFFLSGPAWFALGLSMLVFPGPDMPDGRLTSESDARRFYEEAPTLHKIVWFVTLTVVLVATFLLVRP